MNRFTVSIALYLFVPVGGAAQSPPPIPSHLIAQFQPFMQPRVMLTWEAPSGPWYFNVYRSIGNNSQFQRIGMAPDRSFHDEGVFPGVPYFYCVTSVAWSDTGQVESQRSNIAMADPGGALGHQQGTIEGTVIADSTGLPIGGVRIRFFRHGGSWTWSPLFAVTDPQGHYEALLDTGSYLIRAEQPGNPSSACRPEWFDDVPEPSLATPVEVTVGSVFVADFSLATFSPPHIALVTGLVTNGQGVPLQNATVAIMRSIQSMDSIAATTGDPSGLGSEIRDLPGIGYTRGVIWSGMTDQSGHYHASVPDGRYVAVAAKIGFLPEYFDDTYDPTLANLVTVGDGSNTPDTIDFSLSVGPVTPYSIRGIVKDSTGSGVASRVILFPRPPNITTGPLIRFAHTNPAGDYEITNIEEGGYVVLAVPFSGYVPAFFKQNEYGIVHWTEADSVLVPGNVLGTAFNVGLLPINSTGITHLGGTIHSSGGVPVRGSRVVARTAAGQMAGSGLTAASGEYSIDALSVGPYTLITDRDGYEGLEMGVTIPPNTYNVSNINFVMNFASMTTVDDPWELPNTIRLDQNYPNPFNPVTRIQYVVPHDQFVSVKVYDILGREVATLVDGIQKTGLKTVLFDGNGLSSGMYIYRLHAGSSMVSKVMMLVK